MSLLGAEPAYRLHSPAFICGAKQMRGGWGGDTDLCVGLSCPRMGGSARMLCYGCGARLVTKVVIKGN